MLINMYIYTRYHKIMLIEMQTHHPPRCQDGNYFLEIINIQRNN